jgi:hypothetical protein
MYHDPKQYHPHSYDGRTTKTAYRISSTDTIAALVSELVETSDVELGWLQNSRIRGIGEAEMILDIINRPRLSRTYTALLNIQAPHDYLQQMNFVKSNLCDGYIFYFICNGCGNRVKYLYQLPNAWLFRCRSCQRLRYSMALTDVEPFKRIPEVWG